MLIFIWTHPIFFYSALLPVINNGQFNEECFHIIVFFLMSSGTWESSWEPSLRCRGQGAAAFWGRLAFPVLPIKWQALDPGRYSGLEQLHLVLWWKLTSLQLDILSQPGVWGNGVLRVKQNRAQVILLSDSRAVQRVLAPGFPRNMHEEVQSPGRFVSFCCLSEGVYRWWWCVGRQISAFLPLSLPVSDALGCCCILRAGTAVLGEA